MDDFVEEALGQSWAGKTLHSFPVPRHFLNFFTTEKLWSGSVDVDLERVKGTLHPDYVGMSWGEFLQKGKRMGPNLSMLEANPGYYLSKGHKEPTMSYVVHDGDYWVYTDGNHRTCIGRFYLDLMGRETVLSGVETWEVKLDLEAYGKWCQAGGIHGLLGIESEIVARDDGPGWMKEKFGLKYFIHGKQVERREFLEFDETVKSSWWRFFRTLFRRANTV